ncbi:NfeD-like C-terminal, partner-binding [Reichenbachiella faecimaris]|uniref:NfeD-like C-terminal, partner-binding n=1 Tax=Reichenbachiella faecimaris TaxID=692418 RepID=A0A1W2GBW1_REIFA|nr:NfeD family protein [Reichenbachiella faecimaris]SMD34160.1 NfeD-like C-terminal, partner-binding [Reichenbachiella faecimaris]
MLDYFLIAFLILAGITLIIVEIIFVPGTTVVGIFGCLVGIYGIYRSYELYGVDTGHVVLAVSLVVGLAAVIFSFKSGAWNKFSNKSVMKTPVNEGLTAALEIGQVGKSISSLKPVGKAEFDEKEYEVSSLGSFVLENTQIKIIKLERNKIIVEPIN